MPNSPKSIKHTAFVDISVGGFGWIAFFTLGGDNTNKKYNQLMAGVLGLNSVKGFEVGNGLCMSIVISKTSLVLKNS